MPKPHTLLLYVLLLIISHSSIFHKIPSITANQKNSIMADQIEGSILSKTIHKVLLSKISINRCLSYMNWKFLNIYSSFFHSNYTEISFSLFSCFFLIFQFYRFLLLICQKHKIQALNNVYLSLQNNTRLFCFLFFNIWINFQKINLFELPCFYHYIFIIIHNP